MSAKPSTGEILQQIADINDQLGQLLKDLDPAGLQGHSGEVADDDLKKLEKLKKKVSRLHDLSNQLNDVLPP